MSTLETLKKIKVNVKLNNGTSSTGNVETVNVGLGSLSTTNFNNQKAMNVVNLLGDCTIKPVYTVEKVATSTLSESD